MFGGSVLVRPKVKKWVSFKPALTTNALELFGLQEGESVTEATARHQSAQVTAE